MRAAVSHSRLHLQSFQFDRRMSDMFSDGGDNEHIAQVGAWRCRCLRVRDAVQ